MPRRPAKACLKCGQAHNESGAYCPTCKKLYSGRGWQRTPEEEKVHRAQYGKRWQQMRQWLLAREPLCRQCQAEGKTTAATEVDHITPLAQGGAHAAANLQPLCRDCHQRKSAREGASASKAAAKGGAP
jgi:5-methylcytosine-specific restriction enzyme A